MRVDPVQDRLVVLEIVSGIFKLVSIDAQEEQEMFVEPQRL